MYASYRAETHNTEVTAMAALKTIVFLGSCREGRMGLRVANFIKKQLEMANHSVEVFGNRNFTFVS